MAAERVSRVVLDSPVIVRPSASELVGQKRLAYERMAEIGIRARQATEALARAIRSMAVAMQPLAASLRHVLWPTLPGYRRRRLEHRHHGFTGQRHRGTWKHEHRWCRHRAGYCARNGR